MNLSNGKPGNKISSLSTMKKRTTLSPLSFPTPRPEGGGDDDDDRDSCYFPGCRKDANCSCDICLASITATLDLMPLSIQKSSLTRLSPAPAPAPVGPAIAVTPLSFGSLSTPTSRPTRPSSSPRLLLRSSARTGKAGPAGEKGAGFAGKRAAVALLICLVFAAELGLPRVLKPVFSSGEVRSVGENSRVVKGVDGKLRFLQRSLRNLDVHGSVSNCSFANSRWEISQDGLLLNSQCKLYKSSTEEIKIWGWPLQTAGLLVTGFSSRSFTVISGRVTEWPEGKAGFVIRAANSSWTHRKWSSSAVQFDPNTWILEYRRSSILENPRLASATLAVLKHWMSRKIGLIWRKLWLLTVFGKSQFYSFGAKAYVQVPPT